MDWQLSDSAGPSPNRILWIGRLRKAVLSGGRYDGYFDGEMNKSSKQARSPNNSVRRAKGEGGSV
jgi:hypothetical protein